MNKIKKTPHFIRLWNWSYFAGTGSDRSIDDQSESGETTSVSNLRIHVEVEGTISSNVSTREKRHSVEFDVQVGENGNGMTKSKSSYFIFF